MARHKLTLEERKRGARKAIASKKTPARLKEGLRKWLKKHGG
jgi:hypothetical protein